MEQEHHVLFCPLLKLPSRMVLLLKIISDVFFKKPLMLKLKMTGKNFSPGILKLLHIRFVENGFNVCYNQVNLNLICGYFLFMESFKYPCQIRRVKENKFYLQGFSYYQLQPIQIRIFTFRHFFEAQISIETLGSFVFWLAVELNYICLNHIQKSFAVAAFSLGFFYVKIIYKSIIDISCKVNEGLTFISS